MTRLLIINFLFFYLNVSGQSDNLNKRNSKGKKNGYWIQYLDSLAYPIDSANSYFYGYDLYDDGQKIFKFSDRNKLWKKYRLIYEGHLPEKGKPLPIEGTFKLYSGEKQIMAEEIYKAGSPYFMKAYSYSSKDTVHSSFDEVLYFDRLYNNIPGTFYYEEYFSGKLEKAYWFRKGRKKWKSYPVKDSVYKTETLKYLDGQDTAMFMHSWANPNKTYEIDANTFLNVSIYKKDTLFSKVSSTHRLGGKLFKIDSSDITFKIDNEYLDSTFSNGRSMKIYNNYLINDSLKKITNYEFRKVKISSITSISFFLEKKNGLNILPELGGGLIFISGITALIIAPLASINYKNGNFNEKKYYSILTFCASGLTIGIPLSVIFRKGSQRNYNLKNSSPPLNDMTDYYYLKKN